MTTVEMFIAYLNDISWVNLTIVVLLSDPITVLLGICLFLSLGWCLRQRRLS